VVRSFAQTKLSRHIASCNEKSSRSPSLDHLPFCLIFAESEPLPKPSWATRAQKQIYRPWFVLNHFVHYTPVPKDLAMYRSEAQKLHLNWSRRHRSRNSERFVDDLSEATMMHTKSTLPSKTVGYKERCQQDYQLTSKHEKCMVGFARPLDWKEGDSEFRINDKYKYNCYMNPRIVTEFAPKLKMAMNSWRTVTK
jgi:hypothetical protein